MWYACICCSNVFDSQAKLDKHYLLRAKRKCRAVLLNRNQVGRPRRSSRSNNLVGNESDGKEESKDDMTTRDSAGPSQPRRGCGCHCTCRPKVELSVQRRTRATSCDTSFMIPCCTCKCSQIKCSYCDKLFITKIDLKQHVVKCHPEVQETMFSIIGKIESCKFSNEVVDSHYPETTLEVKGSSSQDLPSSSKSQHFQLRDYHMEGAQASRMTKVPKLTCTSEVPKKEFKIEGTVCPNLSSSHGFQNTSLPVVRLEQCAPSNSSSHKGNVKKQFDLKEKNQNEQTPGDNISVPQTRSTVVQNKQALNSNLKSTNEKQKRVLSHLCYFCREKFPEEADHLVHLLHTHLNGDVKIRHARLQYYGEILATRLEIKALNSPGKPTNNSSSSSSSALKPSTPRYDFRDEERSSQRASSEEHPGPIAKVLLEDIGDQIVMDCPICITPSLKLLERISHMKNHLEEVRPSPDELICPLCSYKCKDMFRWKEHASLHFRVKTFSCSYCWAGFTQKTTLQLHMGKMHRDLFKSKKRKSRKI